MKAMPRRVRSRWLSCAGFVAALALGVAACTTGSAAAPSAPVSGSEEVQLATDATAEPAVEPTVEPTALQPATARTTQSAAEPAPEPVSQPPVPRDPLAPAEPIWHTTDMGVKVPDQWRSCSTAEDCEAVVTTCCDECNGGKAVSVAERHVAEVRAKFRPTGCGACTKRGCTTRTACENERCVLQWMR
jgi:hypothetical protein